MSATFWLEIDTGGGEPATIDGTDFNVTYNLGPMLRAAGMPDWGVLRGSPASEAAGVLDGVARKLHADKDSLRAQFTPGNGWGSWEWAVEFTEKLRDACAAHPKAILGASL